MSSGCAPGPGEPRTQSRFAFGVAALLLSPGTIDEGVQRQ